MTTGQLCQLKLVLIERSLAVRCIVTYMFVIVEIDKMTFEGVMHQLRGNK